MMPNNVAVIYELVRMLIYRSYGDIRYVGDIAEAEQWAARAVEVAPNDSRAHTINCYALVRAEKASAAVQSCIRAIEINPNDAESHAYLSMAQYDLQRTSAALNEAREAVRLNPRSIDANIAYALSLSFQGQFDQALEHYKNAASLNAKLEFPLFQMAFFAYTLGNAQQERNPTRAETLYRIALSAYNTILQNNPNSVKAYTRICQTYLAKATRVKRVCTAKRPSKLILSHLRRGAGWARSTIRAATMRTPSKHSAPARSWSSSRASPKICVIRLAITCAASAFHPRPMRRGHPDP